MIIIIINEILISNSTLVYYNNKYCKCPEKKINIPIIDSD